MLGDRYAGPTLMPYSLWFRPRSRRFLCLLFHLPMTATYGDAGADADLWREGSNPVAAGPLGREFLDDCPQAAHVAMVVVVKIKAPRCWASPLDYVQRRKASKPHRCSRSTPTSTIRRVPSRHRNRPPSEHQERKPRPRRGPSENVLTTRIANRGPGTSGR